MKTLQPSFDTITETLNWLTKMGFTHDFNAKNSKLSDDLSIKYIFRFEGDTDPGDENILYAIQSDKLAIKGVLFSAFGVYADSSCDEIINKLLIH